MDRSEGPSPRIETGLLKGMNLEVAPGVVTRPTGAKVRAAVLNALQADLSGAKVLDLFAGTGALGLEAVSRGASSARFVEKDRVALRALEKNVGEAKRRLDKQGKLEVELSVVAQDVMSLLTQNSSAPRSDGVNFDVVWADPPWAEVPALASVLLKLLAPQVAVGGVFVLESGDGAEDIAPFQSDGWNLTKSKTYGKTRITIYRRV